MTEQLGRYVRVDAIDGAGKTTLAQSICEGYGVAEAAKKAAE